MATVEAESDQLAHEASDLRATNARLREESSNQYAPRTSADDDASTTSSRRSNRPNAPPRFTIDLSLPPEQRYLEVCTAFKGEMLNLTALFDEVVGDMVHFIPTRWLHFLCKLFLRRVYDREENAELKGISKATGVQMYLLVCFNVLLDLFMGCSSGGAVVKADSGSSVGSKMVHFRTLDWGMPSLRRVIVHLDFVAEPGRPVIASSVTYAGYVGVLTGVRKGFSVSLNFRPNRVDNGKFWADVKYAWHHLMVLLGRRQSISSLLRHLLLPQLERKRIISWPPFTKKGKKKTMDYESIIKTLAGEEAKSRAITTTACYLCLCNGEETTTIEKDRISAVVRSSTEFIVVTNSDEEDTSLSPGAVNAEEDAKTAPAIPDASLQEIVAEARDRTECARNNWNNLRVAKSKHHPKSIDRDLKALCTVDDVIELVQQYPTTNECTHFACVMDPLEGNVSWCRRWIRPVGANWIRAHMSETWLPAVP